MAGMLAPCLSHGLPLLAEPFRGFDVPPAGAPAPFLMRAIPTARRQQLTRPRERDSTTDLLTCTLSSPSMYRCITSEDKLVREAKRGGGLLEGSHITRTTAVLTNEALSSQDTLFRTSSRAATRVL